MEITLAAGWNLRLPADVIYSFSGILKMLLLPVLLILGTNYQISSVGWLAVFAQSALYLPNPRFIHASG